MIYGEYIPVARRVSFQMMIAAQRRAWLEKAHARNPRCHYCRNRTELKPREYNQFADHFGELFATLDHAIPRSQGGRDVPKNFRLACSPCNQLKGAMGEREFMAFLIEEGIRDAA